MELWLIKNKIKEKLVIMDRLFKCDYCNVYSTFKGTIFYADKNFCCKDCKCKWVNEE